MGSNLVGEPRVPEILISRSESFPSGVDAVAVDQDSSDHQLSFKDDILLVTPPENRTFFPAEIVGAIAEFVSDFQTFHSLLLLSKSVFHYLTSESPESASGIKVVVHQHLFNFRKRVKKTPRRLRLRLQGRYLLIRRLQIPILSLRGVEKLILKPMPPVRVPHQGLFLAFRQRRFRKRLEECCHRRTRLVMKAFSQQFWFPSNLIELDCCLVGKFSSLQETWFGDVFNLQSLTIRARIDDTGYGKTTTIIWAEQPTLMRQSLRRIRILGVGEVENDETTLRSEFRLSESSVVEKFGAIPGGSDVFRFAATRFFASFRRLREIELQNCAWDRICLISPGNYRRLHGTSSPFFRNRVLVEAIAAGPCELLTQTTIKAPLIDAEEMFQVLSAFSPVSICDEEIVVSVIKRQAVREDSMLEKYWRLLRRQVDVSLPEKYWRFVEVTEVVARRVRFTFH